MPAEMEKVFKALADGSRRHLLDLLHANNGQTLGELCEHLDMARQSATQHLAVLEAANLISTVKRGREKLHYLNPVPLQEIQERWIDKFERPRLRTLSAVRRHAEGQQMSKPEFVYVTYIESTPEKVWEAITDPDLSGQWWGHGNVSDWKVGSSWEHRRTDGSGVADIVGTVLESDPPRRLVLDGSGPGEERPNGPGVMTFDIEPHGSITRLTVTDGNYRDEEERAGSATTWPGVLANLKSFLETGSVLSEVPWQEPASR
ncbi:metalloregulator ArsR/SmtB family transcription factor [Actinomycetes bacterium KLBMP 9759]